jgi:MFS family permease
MIRNWYPVASRGAASSIVAMGGRSGAVLAPLLTAFLMSGFATLALSLLADSSIAPPGSALNKALAGGWRPVLVIYGFVGIVVAMAFAILCRNTPQEHPLCNDAERRLISGDSAIGAVSSEESGFESLLETRPAAVAEGSFREKTEDRLNEESRPSIAADSESHGFPLIPLLTSVSLWGNSLTQFFTNIGWLFVVTWLPRYLENVHKVPLKEQALMTAVPTLAGIAGMLWGGWWTDMAARRFGLKWGRCLPIMVTRLTAAGGYGICLAFGLLYFPDPNSRWLPWMVVVGLSIATFSADLGVPAMWAYSQDVGGKYTASVMGWANMHGNFGAAVAPLMYNAILGETPTLSQWNTLFAFCAAVFALSCFTGMVVDGTKPIRNPTPSLA